MIDIQGVLAQAAGVGAVVTGGGGGGEEIGILQIGEELIRAVTGDGHIPVLVHRPGLFPAGVALGGGKIYTDYFVLDAQAATANAASKKISVAKSADADKFSESSKYLKVNPATNGRLSQSALNATISKSAVKINVVAPRTLKSATPVKRQTKVLASK